ncbi:MAG: mechanosensitive ion channel domain-containing protein [Moheibacter sp.]
MEIQLRDSHTLVTEWLDGLSGSWGISGNYLPFVNLIVLLILSLLFLVLLQFIIRRILLKVAYNIAKKSKTKFDDYLIQNKVLRNIAGLVPLYLSVVFIPLIFAHFPSWVVPAQKFIDLLLIFAWVLVLSSLFRSIKDHLQTKKGFEGKPLDSYLQVSYILLYFIGGVIAFTLISGNSPWAFITAMGAASAVLMLVFKDTILGFVASIQVSTNDMVRIGDWIEMPKYQADGDVIEINLNTVKIQNWDKTITTIPTYYLITDSFKNWRGMQNTGGRRIKRAINIKISSIHYLSEEELEELRKIKILVPFLDSRQAEIDQYNQEHFPDRSMPVNGRNMTNIGVFRQYANEYIRQNPNIRQDMTMIVRQLAPTEHGLPLELYMFSADTRWAVYENVMADIFDHLLAAIQYFNLEVFENPSSDDLRSLNLNKSPEILN